MPSFEEEYFDVLKAIETSIVTTYAAHPDAKDRYVDAALGGLTRTYNAALKGKNPPRLKFNATEQAFFNNVQAALQAFTSGGALTPSERTYSIDEAALCVKRIQRSVGTLMKAGGASGTKYLEFVRDYQNKTQGG